MAGYLYYGLTHIPLVLARKEVLIMKLNGWLKVGLLIFVLASIPFFLGASG